MRSTGGVRLTEDQYEQVMSQLLEAEELADVADDRDGVAVAGNEIGPSIVARLRSIREMLEQEHYPVVPEPDTGLPF